MRLPFRRRSTVRPPAIVVGAPAVDVTGSTPSGDRVTVECGVGHAVLMFLTSTCFDCHEIWADLVAHPWAGPGRLVVVTPSPSTESARDVAQLGRGIDVVMSSDVWHAYGVTGAPTLVVVEDGVVVRGGPPAPGWRLG